MTTESRSAKLRAALLTLPVQFTKQQALDHVIAAGGFEEDLDQWAREGLAKEMQRELKRMKELNGRDTYGSVLVYDENEGEHVRKYVQMTIATEGQRLEVRDGHVAEARYHIKKANVLTQHVNADFHRQLPLPFPNYTDEAEPEEPGEGDGESLDDS